MKPETTHRDKLIAVFGLLLALFLVALDQTIVGTAMPRVIADLRGFDVYAWVTTVYLLTQTATIPIAGKLGDLYGRKWVLIGGIVIFLLSSWLCGFAPTMWWLILARGLQGVGAGAIFSTVFTMIADVFPNPSERARYQGLFFAVFSLSSVIGPIVGGTITDTVGWRWVFYVNIPLGILSLILLPFVLPNTDRHAHGKIDWLGAVVSTIGVIALLLGFTWVGQGEAWTSPRVLAAFAVALIAIVLFFPIERRASDPIIPFALFRNRTISAITVMMFLCSIAMFGMILYLPLFLQGVMGLSASTSGTILIPLVLTMTLVSIVGGQFVSRVGRVRPFLIFGAAAMAVGSLLVTTIDATTSLVMIGAFMFVMGLGLGLLLPNSTLTVQSVVEPRNLGVATSSTQFIRFIGATVGTAIMGSLVTSGYTGALLANLPSAATTELTEAIKHPDALVSPDALNSLEQIARGLPNGEQLMLALLDAGRHALAVGIHQGFLLLAVSSVLALAAAFMIPPFNLKSHPMTVEVEVEGLSNIPTPHV